MGVSTRRRSPVRLLLLLLLLLRDGRRESSSVALQVSLALHSKSLAPCSPAENPQTEGTAKLHLTVGRVGGVGYMQSCDTQVR